MQSRRAWPGTQRRRERHRQSVIRPPICRGELGLDPEKVNVNGGAVALGHAIGQSGSRLLTTILYELKKRDAKRGIVALCLGGGNAVALAVER